MSSICNRNIKPGRDLTLRNDIYRLVKRCFGFNAATVSTLKTDPLGPQGVLFFFLLASKALTI